MIDVWQGRYVEAEAGFRELIPHCKAPRRGARRARCSHASVSRRACGARSATHDDAFAAAVAAEQLRQAALRLAVSRLGERQAINFQEYPCDPAWISSICRDAGRERQARGLPNVH